MSSGGSGGSNAVRDFEAAKTRGDTAAMKAAREIVARANGANASATQGSYSRDGTWTPSGGGSVGTDAGLMPASTQDLLSGNFGKNYITGNSLWVDPRVNNAQRAMIQSNFYAKQAGNANPYSADQISGAANGGYAGYSYSPGRNSYSYVQEQKKGGQNYISPTIRTDQAGNTVQYRGYANEPLLGAYNNGQGKQKPQDMNYSWERTGGIADLLDGAYKFNQAGADAAAARDLTVKLTNLLPESVKLTGLIPGQAVGGENAATTNNNTGLTSEAVDRIIQQNNGNYLNSPEWVGNVYPDAKWDNTTRTITAGGKVLREGIDFIINPADNRAYVVPETYANSYGSSLAPTATTQDASFKLRDYIGEMQKQNDYQYQSLLDSMPKPQAVDYSSFIPAPQQGVAATANPADTYFVPTARYNDRVLQAKQAAAELANRDYLANMQAWQAQAGLIQDQEKSRLSFLNTLLPYSQMTAAQKAEMEMQKAASMLKQQDVEINRAWDKFNAGVASDADYALLGITPGTLPLALAAKGGSGGGGYSGGSRSSGGAGYADNPGYYLDTQGERANVATGSLFDLATKQYEQNTRGGGNASQYPLYYTLNSLFNDPKWRTAATSSGANIKKVADALITKYSGKTPKDYFSAGRAKGSNVAAAYKQLLSQAERDSWDDY